MNKVNNINNIKLIVLKKPLKMIVIDENDYLNTAHITMQVLSMGWEILTGEVFIGERGNELVHGGAVDGDHVAAAWPRD